jgi:hypothetical protein
MAESRFMLFAIDNKNQIYHADCINYDFALNTLKECWKLPKRRYIVQGIISIKSKHLVYLAMENAELYSESGK